VGVQVPLFMILRAAEPVLSGSASHICPLSVPVSVQQPLPAPTGTTEFKVGEESRGAVKDCYYSALGQLYVSTVSAMALCPLSVTVP
jgi:hypothetical protein